MDIPPVKTCNLHDGLPPVKKLSFGYALVGLFVISIPPSWVTISFLKTLFKMLETTCFLNGQPFVLSVSGMDTNDRLPPKAGNALAMFLQQCNQHFSAVCESLWLMNLGLDNCSILQDVAPCFQKGGAEIEL